jgi:hypothetical protein
LSTAPTVTGSTSPDARSPTTTRDLGPGDLCEPTVCVQDYRWADQYGTPVGSGFTRTGTLADGADRCDFFHHPTSGVTRT